METQDNYAPMEGHGGDLKTDANTRLGFVKKVFGILTTQFLFTAVFVTLSMKSIGFKATLMDPTYLAPILVAYFASFCAIACCG